MSSFFYDSVALNLLGFQFIFRVSGALLFYAENVSRFVVRNVGNRLRLRVMRVPIGRCVLFLMD